MADPVSVAEVSASHFEAFVNATPELPENAAESVSGGGGFSWPRIRSALRRWWWIPLVMGALAGGAAAAYVHFQPPGYVSTAQMWVRGKMRVSEVAEFTEDPGNFYGTQITLMQSDQMRERAIRRLRTQDPNFTIPVDEHGRPTSARVRVIQARSAAVFSMECVSRDPGYAQSFLNALMDEFLAYKQEVRATTAGDILASVSDQVYKQERNLKVEQEKLNQFQREHNLALIEEQVKGGAGQLAQLHAQLSMLKLDLSLLDAATLESRDGVPATNSFLGMTSDPSGLLGMTRTGSGTGNEIATARQRLETLRTQSLNLARYLRPKHPKMVALAEEITKQEKAIEFLGRQNVEHMATVKEAMKMRIKSLEDTIGGLEAKVSEANRYQAEAEAIRNSIERQRSLYEQLLSLLRTVDLNRNIDQEAVAILERASPAYSTKSKALPTVLGSGALGIMLGLALVGFIARGEDRCESLEDVRSRFDEEVVGLIPNVRVHARADSRKQLQMQHSEQVFAESCRGLRSTLLYWNRGGPNPRTILLTSATPNEGKSTVALNLAQALSMGGARVLLIDGDLRRGALHEMVGNPNQTGLSDLLRNGGELAGGIVATEHPNLWFIPRGTNVRWTGELFLTESFRRLLSEARSKFDYVILDTVPVFAADDATSIAPQMDGVLFVVRRGVTRAKEVREALDMLYQRQAKVLGLVFNRVDTTSRSYRYYKYSEYYATAAS